METWIKTFDIISGRRRENSAAKRQNKILNIGDGTICMIHVCPEYDIGS